MLKQIVYERYIHGTETCSGGRGTFCIEENEIVFVLEKPIEILYRSIENQERKTRRAIKLLTLDGKIGWLAYDIDLDRMVDIFKDL